MVTPLLFGASRHLDDSTDLCILILIPWCNQSMADPLTCYYQKYMSNVTRCHCIFTLCPKNGNLFSRIFLLASWLTCSHEASSHIAESHMGRNQGQLPLSRGLGITSGLQLTAHWKAEALKPKTHKELNFANNSVGLQADSFPIEPQIRTTDKTFNATL